MIPVLGAGQHDAPLVVVIDAATLNKRCLYKKPTEQGFKQGGKMFWGGAFAMKSAIRQSSFDAYKKVFAALRSDIATVLQTSKPA